MVALDQMLVALTTMSSAQLRAEWLRVYRSPAPSMTADLLRRGIAHRLQERAQGGLPPNVVREIERMMKQLEKTGAVIATPPVTIKPGTRLVRDWGGASHHVLVLDQGFLYRERHYRSLTQIAGHITGARWSGPRFFGLQQRSRDGEPVHA